jgi:hypothetical protein
VAPPSSDGFDREFSRVVVDADADPRVVEPDVVDAVWDGLAQLLVDEVVNPNRDRLTFGLPLASCVLEISAGRGGRLG